MARRYAKPTKKTAKTAEDDEDVEDETDPEPAREPVNTYPAPRERAVSSYDREADSEIVDFSAWPGTADAAKIAQVHPSTIKNWRSSGRLKAQMNPATGQWLHDPDSLAELIGQPETTDPATLLATGMSSIVQQGERAGDRLIAMTELTNASLQRVLELQGLELDRAYARIATLETERSDLLDRSARAMEASFKHERFLKRMDHEHEVALADKRDGSDRLRGLLEILGPIGASIAARVVGDEPKAQTAEAKAISQSSNTQETVEAKIVAKLGELATAVRSLDDTEFKAFRLMLPDEVGKALDVVRRENDGSAAGAALAYICKTACALSREQFDAIAPIAPKLVSIALTELRQLINEEK
jgi:hypothetical protein